MNLICGINPVLEALSAGARQFDRLLIVKGVRNRRVSEAIRMATQLGVPLRFEGRHALDRMANGLNHQGLIAVVSSKAVVDLETLLDSARDPALIVVLDGVEDPRNLGAILRTAEAAGAHGVVQPERHSAPLSETVSRASAGALEYVQVARVGNLSQALETIKARGLWVVGFDASATERWHAPDYKRPVALVFGGEGRGMRRLVREHCDEVVALPLFGHMASLNVSVTVGAALYEVVRQRGFVPSHVRPIPVRPPVRPREIVGPSPEDGEEDPGRIDPEPITDGAGVSPPENDGGESGPHTISVIDLLEEVGWARSPSASVVSIEAGTGGGPRRREDAPREPRPSREIQVSPADPHGEPPPAGRPPGSRRRRRRRGGFAPNRDHVVPAEKQPGGETQEQSRDGAAGQAPQPAGSRDRRRRHRRRRR